MSRKELTTITTTATAAKRQLQQSERLQQAVAGAAMTAVHVRLVYSCYSQPLLTFGNLVFFFQIQHNQG